MNFDRMNEQLHKVATTKKIEDIHALVGFLVELFGITQCKPEELFIHASVQREINRFVPAQGFRNQASAYTIPHDSGLPIDIKLFWLKKTTKANMSWAMALTPNYEDNIETNTNMNIGIDIVVSENAESVFIVLSNNLKVRVLELNGSLSLTQQEIFDNWVKIGKTINRESEHFKSELHKLLWKSFDFEPINRKFYLQLVEQFDHLVGHLKKNIEEESAKMFAVRLIGRTLFLWFLRKKEFINPEKEYFTVSGDADQTDYYRTKLEPLFFDVLNTEMKSRDYDDTITPFLNGGLFEPIDTDFYKSSKLTFPAGFFTQFFNILNHYNFTVDEGTSEYEQVAVDPEMLGRVFENLLASINPDTATNARDANGAFYTPREIVDYMCEQSLIEYLKTKLPDTANRDRRIEELVTMDEATFREQDHNKRRDWKKDLGQEQVIKALDELRILDPAVGSGAFPMGMLSLLVKVHTRIDTALEKDLAQLKRDILSRSLYGVDIDQMAIQISRLRAWLSILVDMENLKKVDPLPNLDFKFVCANTLIPLAGLDATNLFDEADLKQDLINIRDAYYSENRKSFKKKLRDQYLERIKDGGLFAELESDRQRQLKDYNPFNPLNSSGSYDPTLMHGVDAFGVVLGNPPYVDYRKIDGKTKKAIENYTIADHSRMINLYNYFFELALKLLVSDGILSFISPQQYLILDNCKGTRDLLRHNTVKLLADFARVKIFDASTYTFVSIIQKKPSVTPGIYIEFNQIQDMNQPVRTIAIPNPITEPVNISEYKTLIEKIELNSTPLDKFADIFCASSSSTLDIINRTDSDPEFLSAKDIKRYFIDFKKNYSVRLNSYGIQSARKQKGGVIYTSRMTSEIRAVYIPNNHLLGGKVNVLVPNDENYSLFITSLLNSKTINFWYRQKFSMQHMQGGALPINTTELKKIPVKINDVTVKNISNLVEKIQEKKKNDINADTSDLDSQIDELVMDLYGLNEEEKEVIRNS